MGHNEIIIIITDIARKRVNVRSCTIPACDVIIKQTFVDINVYRIVGKFGGGKVWQINRLADRLLIVIWMVLVWQIRPNSPNFPAMRYVAIIACKIMLGKVWHVTYSTKIVTFFRLIYLHKFYNNMCCVWWLEILVIAYMQPSVLCVRICSDCFIREY